MEVTYCVPPMATPTSISSFALAVVLETVPEPAAAMAPLVPESRAIWSTLDGSRRKWPATVLGVADIVTYTFR